MSQIDVRALRQAWGFTQAQLARAMGVTEQSIYNWERGLQVPTRYDAVVLLRMQELLKDPTAVARVKAAVMQAQEMPPAPVAQKSDDSDVVGIALAAGAVGFGLGLLLAALFSGDSKNSSKTSARRKKQPPKS